MRGLVVEKALVLGGGGVTGIAWEIGVLAGLAERGVDLTDADLVVGTSAGSVVGVDMRSGTSLADLYHTQTQPPGGSEICARMGLGVMAGYLRAMLFSRKPEAARARVGAMALRAKTETEEARRRVIESRLPIQQWPAGRLQITAVDAVTGDLAIFDAASNVRLLDAVGASCAVPGIWPPVTINGRRYIDGGIRSAANADLAAGCDTIIIIAPLVSGYGPLASPVNQARALSEAGALVTVIKPDKAALRAIGRNVLDPARRPAAALAGYVQAESVARETKAVWSG
ncbi:MAG: patatin-like phospholipase family protein [Streptosporangiaceae bacterium]